MNPYEELDPRPNTVETEESNDAPFDGLVQENITNKVDEKVDSVPSEEKTSVAIRDFSEDLELYMAKYPAYKHMLGMDVPMRSYMWSFFSGIVNMYLCEEEIPRLPDDLDCWANLEILNDSKFALDEIVNILKNMTDPFDKSLRLSILDKMLYVASTMAWAYLKFRGYEDKFVVPSEPTEKDDVEMIVEKLGEVE